MKKEIYNLIFKDNGAEYKDVPRKWYDIVLNSTNLITIRKDVYEDSIEYTAVAEC